jgi:uncharacterized integral membrane protein
MKKIKLIGALAGVLVIVVVIVQNTGTVTTRFLFLTITTPNAVLIGVTFLIGVCAGILLSLISHGN